MPTIHPTAIVDRQADLAPDVQVGPGCIIEGPVVVGAGTRLLGRVWLQGPLWIGARNVIYPNACLGLEPQDRKFPAGKVGPGLRLGDQNVIREGATLHRATGEVPTTVGSGCYLMANTHVGHDARVGDNVVMANGALLGGHVVLGDNVTMGGNSAVHQFCRLGRLSIISGVAAVTQDVPPFCMVQRDRRVAALNVVGLRRAGLADHLAALLQAFNILYRRGLPNPRAAEVIAQELGHDPPCREFADFIRGTRRGLTSLDESASPADLPG